MAKGELNKKLDYRLRLRIAKKHYFVIVISSIKEIFRLLPIFLLSAKFWQ